MALHEAVERPRFYGVYRAKVVTADDPEARGRVKMRVPSVLEDEVTEWAWPVRPIGTAPADTLDPPGAGDGIWAMFEGGDPEFPVWIGVF